jgi:hypothetical protein
MAKDRIGKLPPRYSLLMNRYTDVRVSKCPKCNRPTHLRKFALLVHIDKWGPTALGKTCRYCTPCEMVVVHQDELETELTLAFERLAPEVVGNDYVVIGTMDRKAWQKGLTGGGTPLEDALEHAADFKHVYDLEVTGGWVPAPPGKS